MAKRLTLRDLEKRVEALEKNAHPPVDISEAVRIVLLRMLMKPPTDDGRKS